MNGPVIAAVGIIAGLAAVGVAAWYAGERAEAKARAILDSTCVCAACRVTPVIVPGQECAACKYRASHHVCPVCELQRVPKAGVPCAICVHALHEELDRWETLP